MAAEEHQILIGSKFRTTSQLTIGVGAQSTLGGTTFLPPKICMKNYQNARILHDFVAEKLSKYRNFYDICPKN